MSSFHIPLHPPPAGLNFVFIILLFLLNVLLNFAYLKISCKWNSSVWRLRLPFSHLMSLRCAAGGRWHCGQRGAHWGVGATLNVPRCLCVRAVLQGVCLEDRRARVMFTGPWAVLRSTCTPSHPAVVMPASVTLHPGYIFIIETALFYR